MGTINAAFNAIFDLLFPLVSWMPPILSLLLISGIVGIVLIMLFGKISNQAGIRRAKDRIQCNLFLIRLYKDELGLTFKAISKVMVFLIPYLGHQFIPLLVMIGPFIIIAGQLNARYGYEEIKPGQRAVVSVKFAEDCTEEQMDVSLKGCEGVVVETRPVRIPDEHEVDFRIRIDKEGDHVIHLAVGSETIEKRVNAMKGLHRVSPVRSSGFVDLLLYPGESALPGDSIIKSITVDIPVAEVSLFGFGIHWFLWFLVFSIAIAFLLKGRFGVEI